MLHHIQYLTNFPSPSNNLHSTRSPTPTLSSWSLITTVGGVSWALAWAQQAQEVLIVPGHIRGNNNCLDSLTTLEITNPRQKTQDITNSKHNRR